MLKVYTKTGDGGTTSLFGGKRVSKDSLRIEANGAVDELNAQIGAVLASGLNDKFVGELLRVQGELFVLGSDLATPADVKVSTSLKLRGASKIPRITKSFVTRLEKEIDSMQKDLPALRNFILPGGSISGSQIHLTRTVARRVERAIAALSAEEKINPNVLIYINRLSDWLFVLARYINMEEKSEEIVWKGRGK